MWNCLTQAWASSRGPAETLYVSTVPPPPRRGGMGPFSHQSLYPPQNGQQRYSVLPLPNLWSEVRFQSQSDGSSCIPYYRSPTYGASAQVSASAINFWP